MANKQTEDQRPLPIQFEALERVQVVGVTVTVVADPVVAFARIREQLGTPRVVAVGKVTGMFAAPVYATRPGLQSVAAIVSVVVALRG